METLEKYQRLNLINQYEILLQLAKSQGNDYFVGKYEQNLEILKNGYVSEYYMLIEGISNEFPKEESALVWDILRIYSYINLSYERLINPKITKNQIRFDGFDGNNESQHLALCEFILITLDRFAELKEKGRDDFNSHSARCERYKAMRQKWIEIGKPSEMSEGQIKFLLSI